MLDPALCIVDAMRDYVFKAHGSWWFVGEDYSHFGPYDTEHEANIDLMMYILMLNQDWPFDVSDVVLLHASEWQCPANLELVR